MQLFFAVTLLVSATLLFLVQPMFAKMVLPLLGGTPAVWNTCMVFYQGVLLLGYLYAHYSTRWLGARRQAMAHFAVLCLPWLVMPIAVATAWTPPGDAPNPIPWLLVLLGFSVGLPFFVVSASAPMLQAWFADTGHPAAKDPYFLYAASNIGSMLGLIGFPAVAETYLTAAQQAWVWAIGYGGLMLLTAGCAVLLLLSRRNESRTTAGAAKELSGTSTAEEAAGRVPTLALRARWLALSFVPSSLLLGVTTYISTDIAAIPLLWVIPLALYLLTFVIVFAQWPTFLSRLVERRNPKPAWLAKAFHPHWIAFWVQPLLIIAMSVFFFDTPVGNMGWYILLHLAAFFVKALICHGELAQSRPDARHLTEFYIWMSVGGVLGGIFNAMVAPLAFKTVIEYPLVVALACMLRPRVFRSARPVLTRWLDLLLPLAVLGGLYLLHEATTSEVTKWLGWNWLEWLNRGVRLATGNMYEFGLIVVILGLAALAAFVFQYRPLRFGMGISVILLASHLWFSYADNALYIDRSFFGVMKVRTVEDAYMKRKATKHVLIHGSTNHGEQWQDRDLREKPAAYYFLTGPIGQAFTSMLDSNVNRELAVVGLGTGTTAALASLGQKITYFEIDPHVRAIAENPKYFSYLTNTAADYEIIMGDGRLSLQKYEQDTEENTEENAERKKKPKFDLLLVDAFSSDAIPMHMITKEAVELYFKVLDEKGILLVHISNRHLDLKPVVGNIAQELGLTARFRDDSRSTASRHGQRAVETWDLEESQGKFQSDVVMLVRKPEYMQEYLKQLPAGQWAEDWEEIEYDPTVGVWTDDFSNVLSVVRWLRKEQ